MFSKKKKTIENLKKNMSFMGCMSSVTVFGAENEIGWLQIPSEYAVTLFARLPL